MKRLWGTRLTLPRILLWCGGLWSVAILTLGLLAAVDLSQGRAAANRAKADLGVDSYADGSLDGDLTQAQGGFRRAARRLDNPLLRPIDLVPVLGRQRRAAVDMARAAGDTSAVARVALQEVATALDPPLDSGPARLRALAALEQTTATASARLDAISLGKGGRLIGPLREARDQLGRQLSDARRDAHRAHAATTAARSLLGGNRHYLLVAANNAEMRSGSGMFLSLGSLRTHGGELTLGEMSPAGDLVLPPPGVLVEGDLAELWGWTDPGLDVRSLGLSPRFEASAPVAARIWEQHTGSPVDGVLVVDVVALEALLRAGGPVTTPSGEIGPDDVERRLLHDQYLGLTFDEASRDQQSGRREELGLIARAVVERIEQGDIDLPKLAGSLGQAAGGRHLLLWSRHETEEDGWDASGVSGKLGPTSVAVGVANRGGNKLDPYLRLATTLSVDPPIKPGAGRMVRMEIAVDNTTPEGEPEYIAGPHPDRDVAAGTYVGLITLNLPGQAADIQTGTATAVVRGADGPTQALALELDLARGGHASFTVSFLLPADITGLVFEPDARVPSGTFHAGATSWPADHRVELDIFSRL